MHELCLPATVTIQDLDRLETIMSKRIRIERGDSLLEEVEIDALLVHDVSRGIRAGDRDAAELVDLLDCVDGDIAGSGDHDVLAFEAFTLCLEHFGDEVRDAVAGGLGANLRSAPGDALAGEDARLVRVGQPLVLTEQETDLAAADADPATQTAVTRLHPAAGEAYVRRIRAARTAMEEGREGLEPDRDRALIENLRDLIQAIEIHPESNETRSPYRVTLRGDLARLALAPGARVLDVGCGNGRDTLFFAQLGFDTLGIDAAQAAIDHCRGLVGGSDRPQARNSFLCRNVLDLRDDRVSVDIVDYVSPVPPGLLARAGNAAFDFDPDDLQSIPESGRGLALILLMMDEVTLHEEADLSRLRLVRHR